MSPVRLLLGAALLATLTLGAARADPYAVNPGGDADGDLFAVSLGGDARSKVLAVSLQGRADCTLQYCTAASGTGDAEGWYAASGMGSATGRAAVTGTGAASGFYGASALGDATGDTLAASGSGDADAVLLAVSGTGDSRGQAALAGCHATGGAAFGLGLACLDPL